MLPKKERLSAEDVSSLEKGRSVFGAYLSLRFRTADDRKFSVSVSKKVSRSAVGRNRIRRRVYAALRNAKKNVNMDVFVLIMPKKECGSLNLSAIKSELESLFRKAGIAA